MSNDTWDDPLRDDIHLVFSGRSRYKALICHEVFASWVGPVSLETWKVFGMPRVIETSSLDDLTPQLWMFFFKLRAEPFHEFHTVSTSLLHLKAGS